MIVLMGINYIEQVVCNFSFQLLWNIEYISHADALRAKGVHRTTFYKHFEDEGALS
ncbi:hypothetical protein [Bacillus sp. S10(2024)]|uniref:hypothetical protein n=1 Tax=Bacillus sp. S10(2024) TaxID=3162886 RepID=UPI003D1A2676